MGLFSSRTPDRSEAERAVMVSYMTLLAQEEDKLASLMSTSQRLLRVFVMQPNDPETRGHVREWFDVGDGGDALVRAVEQDDHKAVETQLDRWLGAMITSMHTDLFNRALAQDLREVGHRSREVGSIWSTEKDLNRLNGRCAALLRRYASDAAWKYVMRRGEERYGPDSAFVRELRSATR